ncbi:MAG: hypothetical protein JKX76_02575 [Colwellia sp.]|nr:hypothetical protein [Colwellia sp.]
MNVFDNQCWDENYTPKEVNNQKCFCYITKIIKSKTLLGCQKIEYWVEDRLSNKMIRHRPLSEGPAVEIICNYDQESNDSSSNNDEKCTPSSIERISALLCEVYDLEPVTKNRRPKGFWRMAEENARISKGPHSMQIEALQDPESSESDLITLDPVFMEHYEICGCDEFWVRNQLYYKNQNNKFIKIIL